MTELKEEVTKRFLETFKEKDENKFEFEKAIKEIIRCYYLILVDEEPNYQGYDLTESEILATVPPIKKQLTLENVKYRMEDQGIDLLELILGCTMQLGINQGMRRGKLSGKQNILMEILNIFKTT